MGGAVGKQTLLVTPAQHTRNMASEVGTALIRSKFRVLKADRLLSPHTYSCASVQGAREHKERGSGWGILLKFGGSGKAFWEK